MFAKNEMEIFSFERATLIRRAKFFEVRNDCVVESNIKIWKGKDRQKIYIIPRPSKPLVIGILALLLICAIILILFFTGGFEEIEVDESILIPPNPIKALPPTKSTLHTFKKAAVCADGPPCAEIGKNILEQNGSAVDATLAAMLCNGLVNMQSMGMGGGFLMTIYIREERKAYTLNARETAPLASTEDMFGSNQNKSKKGPFAMGVPGELKGYYEAHKRFGKLPWATIVEPTIKLCENGYKLGIPQQKSVSNLNSLTQTYKDWFTNENGEIKKVGDTVIPKVLCNTLRILAENGPNDFYKGTIANMVAEDLRNAGSLITKEDLEQYQATWDDPITVEFNKGNKLYSVPPPGSGVLLGFILQILDGYKFNRNDLGDLNSTLLTYHRMVEAFKYTYARRTELGDPNHVNITYLIEKLTSPEYAEEIRKQIDDFITYDDPRHYGAVFYDHSGLNGTAHISVLAENGDAVSVTSTINLYFGSEVVSKSTGITFNSGMDDFSNAGFRNYFGLPGSPNNAIAPGKRPLSSMTPSIITDKNDDVVIVIGASGGTFITTSVAQVIMRVLMFGQNIKEAVDAPRLHHQVYPMSLSYEYGTLQQIVDGLHTYGHNMTRSTSFSVICALFRRGETIFANADNRKGGDVYGID